MEVNSIQSYIEGDHKVGFDKYLILQLKVDGWFASKFGLTAIGPTGFILGFAMAYFIFSQVFALKRTETTFLSDLQFF